jgi:aldose 1-epimerase
MAFLFGTDEYGISPVRKRQAKLTKEQTMSVRKFGVVNGVAVQEICLASVTGATASILTWGATLRDFVVPLSNGDRRRVVLGYESIEGYRVNPGYLGATVGRNCNRIAGGRFTLDGVNYQLDTNDSGKHHLHGGNTGFSRRNWEISSVSDDSVSLSLVSEDGDQNYPGHVEVMCQYHLLGDSTLRVSMSGSAHSPTLLNMTHHSYFNLGDGADIRDHSIQIHADFYTPSDHTHIPTGEIRNVAGTPYDFRALKRIGDGGIDYNINYVLGGATGNLVSAARLVSPARDLELAVFTSEPGMMFYSGFALEQTAPGIAGQKHGANSGLCLEPQRFPDAVNRRHFASAVLRPGESYLNISEYRFESRGK